MTLQELSQQLGTSRTTAFEHVEALREKGLLKHSVGKARSLNLTPKAQKLLKQNISEQPQRNISLNDGIPLVGKIAAGYPIEAIEQNETLNLSECFGHDVFALQVRGDSMIDSGIFDGDFVVCRKTQTADDGRLVVAIVDEQNATLKRFFKEETCARLEPANENYSPIYTNNCRIQGVVVGVIRKI